MTHFTEPGRPLRIQRRKWLHLANFSELTQRLHLPKGGKSRKTTKVWEPNRFREYQLEYLMLQEGMEKNGKQDTATCHWRKGEIRHQVISLCEYHCECKLRCQSIPRWWTAMVTWCHGLFLDSVTPYTPTEWRKNNKPRIQCGRQKPQHSENPQPSPMQAEKRHVSCTRRRIRESRVKSGRAADLWADTRSNQALIVTKCWWGEKINRWWKNLALEQNFPGTHWAKQVRERRQKDGWRAGNKRCHSAKK